MVSRALWAKKANSMSCRMRSGWLPLFKSKFCSLCCPPTAPHDDAFVQCPGYHRQDADSVRLLYGTSGLVVRTHKSS